MVTPYRVFKVTAMPVSPVPDAVYYVRTGPDTVECYVTDDNSNMIPLVGNTEGALMVINRLAELDTPEAKAAARQNLELQDIDGGTFN